MSWDGEADMARESHISSGGGREPESGPWPARGSPPATKEEESDSICTRCSLKVHTCMHVHIILYVCTCTVLHVCTCTVWYMCVYMYSVYSLLKCSICYVSISGSIHQC